MIGASQQMSKTIAFHSDEASRLQANLNSIRIQTAKDLVALDNGDGYWIDPSGVCCVTNHGRRPGAIVRWLITWLTARTWVECYQDGDGTN